MYILGFSHGLNRTVLHATPRKPTGFHNHKERRNIDDDEFVAKACHAMKFAEGGIGAVKSQTKDESWGSLDHHHENGESIVVGQRHHKWYWLWDIRYHADCRLER